MDAKRRSELIAGYKSRKVEKGLVSLRCVATGEEFLKAASDTHAMTNRLVFQPSMGVGPSKRLQGLWDAHGEDGFEIAVVSRLESTDPDEDSAEELEELLERRLRENPRAERI